MKNKVLPFSLLVLLSAFLLFSFSYISKKETALRGNDSYRGASTHFAKIRNNQHTGLLDANDVLTARQQIQQNQASHRSVTNLDWQKLGPDNFAGRTRAVIWDNQNPEGATIYAAGVTGGIWKSTTAGVVWDKVNGWENNLFVSCMVQDNNGTIYAGTGEMFSAEDFSVFGSYGYTGGLEGSGIYKSNDGENFEPVNDELQNDPDWLYVNKLAFDVTSGKLYAATIGGLKYSSDQGQSWMVPNFAIDSTSYYISKSYTIQCDSFMKAGDEVILYNPDTTGMMIDTTTLQSIRTIQEMQGLALDVKVASDGSVIAMVDGYTFVYQAGGDFVFVNKANLPTNPYFITKDSVYSSTSITSMYSGDTSFNETMVSPFSPHTGTKKDIPTYAGLIEYAFAPSNPHIVYAVAVHSTGYGLNVYRSNDQGNSWYVILPGAANPSSPPVINIWDNKGVYANTIQVFPNNPDKILVGGIDMWEGIKINETGYFNWLQRSSSDGGQFLPTYCNADHHVYAFHPSYSNQLLIGTDGGIYFALISGGEYEFQPKVTGFMTTQFYTIAYSGDKDLILGGAQERGTIRITGHGNSQFAGDQIWNSETGGSCAISLINPQVYIYSSIAGTPAFRRSEDAGTNFSATAFMDNISVSETDFLVPSLLWESFNDYFSRDSVKFIAEQNYNQGDMVQVRSNNGEYPFDYQLPGALAEGDSLMIQDIVQAKYFLGVRSHVYMSLSIHDFTQGVVWYDIANNTKTEFQGTPSCFGLSKDANHLFVGTLEGKLFRMSNIAKAYNQATADCTHEECVIATKHIPVIDPNTGEEITQAITSISVDPQHDKRIIVTLGNYGNENYIYLTDNSLDSLPAFRSIQGNPENGGLPLMPVYSSLIEMSNSELAIIGTEHGIYTSENISATDPTWTKSSVDMGNVPVMMLRQQLVDKLPEVVMLINGIDTSYLTYQGTDNFGCIYGATYGRGLFRSDTYEIVGIDEPEDAIEMLSELSIYPNPVKDFTHVAFTMYNQDDVVINIFDINGRLVDNKRLGALQTGDYELRFNMKHLTEGTYIMQLSTSSVTSTGKFIVVK